VRRLGRWLVLAIAVWAAVAYLVLPSFWRHYEHLPAMAAIPTVTHTPNGLPGDPLNVALVGSEEDVLRAFAAAHWWPAGHNGGGDRYYTDGEMAVGVLAPPVPGRRVTVLADPVPIVVKQQFWSWIRPLLAD